MLKRKQIVEVAKDVLKQIKAKKVILRKSGYLAAAAGTDLTEIKDLQELATSRAACHVCARGALIMSKARLYNHCKIEPSSYELVDNCTLDDAAETFSKKDFPKDIWARAELAFEGWKAGSFYTADMDASVSTSEKEQEACYKFYLRYPGQSEPKRRVRLAAICRNIIRNEGVFRPKGL